MMKLHLYVRACQLGGYVPDITHHHSGMRVAHSLGVRHITIACLDDSSRNGRTDSQ